MYENDVNRNTFFKENELRKKLLVGNYILFNYGIYRIEKYTRKGEILLLHENEKKPKILPTIEILHLLKINSATICDKFKIETWQHQVGEIIRNKISKEIYEIVNMKGDPTKNILGSCKYFVKNVKVKNDKDARSLSKVKLETTFESLGKDIELARALYA